VFVTLCDMFHIQCRLHIYEYSETQMYVCIQRPAPPHWGLDTRLTTLLCKKTAVMKSKKVKTYRIFQGRLWFKKSCFANNDDEK
jgi:hypothetical protein